MVQTLIFLYKVSEKNCMRGKTITSVHDANAYAPSSWTLTSRT